MRRHLLTCVAILALTAMTAPAVENESNLLTNGSFELWSHHGTERLKEIVKNDPAFEGDDPLIPTRWSWRVSKPMKLKQSADAHLGKYSLAVSSPSGGDGQLSMGKLEVVPGAKYTFGVWAKGSGQVTVEVLGEAPEGWQQLGVVTGKPKDKWTDIGSAVEIPRHIRLVWLRVSLGAPCEMVLDDAHISAAMDKPYDVDAVLTKKYDSDADTLLLLDFDKDDPALKLEGKMKITGADGGRFGPGLRLDGAKLLHQVATKPFKLPAMPVEGTLEFWFSPDEMPMMADWRRQNLYLQVRGPSNELFTLMAGTDTTVSMSYRIDADTYGKTNHIQTDSTVTSLRMRKGEWHHVAVTWDQSAWRMYFDGALCGMTTKPPLKWWDSPVAVTIGSEYQHLTWNGLIDEIRISKVKRYGPLTPKGVVPVPL